MAASSEILPGVVLLDELGRVTEATATAERALALVHNQDDVSQVFRALCARARLRGDGLPVVSGVPTSCGGRLLLIGACAGRRLAVVVEPQPASSGEPALTSLTPREQQVVELVTQGMATKTIAHELKISPWTVSDHLKAIFAKTGVSTRGELMALLLAEHRAAA
jgi:DNA-binding CsgD family transcriptional regulator